MAITPLSDLIPNVYPKPEDVIAVAILFQHGLALKSFKTNFLLDE